MAPDPVPAPGGSPVEAASPSQAPAPDAAGRPVGTDRPSAGRRIGVVHLVNVWLSLTMTWDYTQIKFLPREIVNGVVCGRTENLEHFPIDNLVSHDTDSIVWRLAASSSWRLRQRRWNTLVAAKARELSAELLHSHFGDQGWSDLAVARKTGLRHVVTFYGYDVSRLPVVEPAWRGRFKEMFDASDLFLCEGPHLGKCLVELGCPAEKVRVQHLGIDLAKLPFRPRRWRPGEPLRVLMASTFVEKKGIPYAIAALGRVKDRAELEISVIGDAAEQPRSRQEKARILAAIDDAGLRARTRLLGFVPYSALLEEAYRNHVFLAPSVTASDGDTEGGAPVIVIEMSASGMPVVSSFHCDIPEVIEDGVTGLLAEERDVSGLEEKLAWLIDSPDSWEPIEIAARQHAEREFSAAAQGERLAAIYRSLVVA